MMERRRLRTFGIIGTTGERGDIPNRVLAHLRSGNNVRMPRETDVGADSWLGP